VRVAIVNDLPIAIEALRRVVLSHPDHSIAWIATGGADAVDQARRDLPDVILMDMIMPIVDGVEATRRIMTTAPCPILVVTATVEGNSGRVYDALGCGAIDAINTPRLGVNGDLVGGAELLRKLNHIHLLHRSDPVSVNTALSTVNSAAQLSYEVQTQAALIPLLVIGASTGGPQAIATVLAALPTPWAHPIVVVQHLGAEFVAGLADWLAQLAGMPVELVERSTALRNGVIYLPAREEHIVSESPGFVTLRVVHDDALHRPSVDVFFHSLATSGASGVAVLLTGMGRDGAAGLKALREAGWWTIAQDRASSVVWGMPGEAVKLGGASEVLAVTRIGEAIAGAFERKGWRTARRPEFNRNQTGKDAPNDDE